MAWEWTLEFDRPEQRIWIRATWWVTECVQVRKGKPHSRRPGRFRGAPGRGWVPVASQSFTMSRNVEE